MIKRKGIILAGGSGTRLYPLTIGVSKQLLPVYDKPMIYYPLSTLMLGGIEDVLIISTPKDTPMIEQLLGDGSRLGMYIEYAVQPEPKGIAQAFLIGEKFIGDDGCTLILGDNIFHGKLDFFRKALSRPEGACIFGYPVRDPERFGVVQFDDDYKVVSLEEKPKEPKSNFAVPGLYVYDNKIIEYTKQVQPSPRGELEITDVNLEYFKKGELRCEPLGRGIAWLDSGTPRSLLEASNYIATVEHQQSYKVACIEEVAFNMNFIDQAGFERVISDTRSPDYREYLEMVLKERLEG